MKTKDYKEATKKLKALRKEMLFSRFAYSSSWGMKFIRLGSIGKLKTDKL